MEKEEIIKKVIEIFSCDNRLNVAYGDDKIIFTLRNINDGESATRQYAFIFPDTFETLANYPNDNNGLITSKHNDEVHFLIKNIDERLLFRIREAKTYTGSDIKITIMPEISDELCAKVFALFPDNSKLDGLTVRMAIRRVEVNNATIYDLMRGILSSYSSLIIKSISGKKVNYDDYAYSFLFNFSMNDSRNYILVDNLEDIIERRSSIGIRVHNNNEDIPYKKYNKEVVRYYLDANSTKNSKIKYLSYYNVLEFYFDKIYIDDKCRVIQNIITSPRFNHGKLNDYKQILEALNIKKANQLAAGVSFKEMDSLKLLIKECINIDSFKSFIQANTYYSENDAHKVTGTKFSINDNNDSLIAKICDRVYKVRNGLVHSKDGENIKYIPHKDEKYIIKELPLIKYLAEEVIIMKSELFN